MGQITEIDNLDLKIQFPNPRLIIYNFPCWLKASNLAAHSPYCWILNSLVHWPILKFVAIYSKFLLVISVSFFLSFISLPISLSLSFTWANVHILYNVYVGVPENLASLKIAMFMGTMTTPAGQWVRQWVRQRVGEWGVTLAKAGCPGKA